MQLPRQLTAALLSFVLAAPTSLFGVQAPADAVSAARPHTDRRHEYQSNELQGDARIIHALNRFTFGLRPGDLAVVRQIGLDNWFEQQLHPESLDLSDLNARLARYPAMQLNTADLLDRFPSNALIRQAMNDRVTVPYRGIEHAIYENQIDRISARRQARQQKKEMANSRAPLQPPAVGANTMSSDAERSESPDPMAKGGPSNNDAAMRTSGDMNMSNPEDSTHFPESQSQIDAVLDLQPTERVAHLAAMRQPEFDRFIKALRPLQRIQLTAGMTPEQEEIVGALENPERLVAEELMAQRLTRDIYSTAQLQEVMTDFWFNHFNIYLRKNETMPYELVSYERDVIRPHALGKFEDLLEAVAHSPAMLMYLDNVQSVGPHSMAAERAEIAEFRRSGNARKAPEGLNENYARELMELHTLGVNGGYTQADVTQVARILTGWTVEQPQRGGGFRFDPRRHEPGNIKALGQKFKDHGEMEGRQLLHYLASRPATAHFLSRELATRFVSDDPPQSLVDRMAQTYLKTGGNISAVLRTLYHSPEFWSTNSYRAKVKTPLEFVVSAVRASDANIQNLRPLANALRQMGMPLYGCVPPTGYDWKASTWVSTGALVDRMNFALALAANRLQGITTSWVQTNDAAATSPVPLAPQAEEARLETMLVAGGVSQTTRSAVLQQFQQQMQQNEHATARPISALLQQGPSFEPQNPRRTERQDQLLAGLLLGSPEFQRR